MVRRWTLAVLTLTLCLGLPVVVNPAASSCALRAQADPLLDALENARRTREEAQLRVVAEQLDERIARSPDDAANYYPLIRVESYFVDVYEKRKDKKPAGRSLDEVIEAVRKSLELHEKSLRTKDFLGWDVCWREVRAESRKREQAGDGNRRQEPARLGESGTPIPHGAEDVWR